MAAQTFLSRLLLTAAAFLLTGCARYEYDIVQPPELAQRVSADRDVVFTRNPLIYRLRSYEEHLVIQINNPTTQPITLLGEQSFIVDPHGQSHPLRTQTMGPESFIKLILPPPSPEMAPAGPIISFGISDAFPGGPGLYDPLADPLWYTPRYYAIVEPDSIYWTWEGETEVRISLTFRRLDQSQFTHEFLFHRHKM